MKFEFDPVKDALNIKKQGLSLRLAIGLFWEEAYVWPDDRFNYDEWRMCALVPSVDRLYYVSYVDRGETRRVINLRGTTRKEVERYAKNA